MFFLKIESLMAGLMNLWSVANALCVFVNGELALGFLELSLSFYGRPNISDRFTFHFIRIQIFQIDFPLILYL